MWPCLTEVTRNQIDSFLPTFFPFVLWEGWRSNFPGPAKTSTEDLWVPKIEPSPAPRAEHWARHEGRWRGDGAHRPGHGACTSHQMSGRSGGPGTLGPGTGGHNIMGTRALDMSTGPLGHQWLTIMLNIHPDEWIGGVLIRRQATGPMVTSGGASSEAEGDRIRSGHQPRQLITQIATLCPPRPPPLT